MNITIRKAKVEDASCIVEAEKEIAQTPGYFCSQSTELNEQAVKHTIQSPQNIYLVAEHESQVVAHAFLEPHPLQSLRHVADLNIAVHLGWQGQGIGKKPDHYQVLVQNKVVQPIIMECIQMVSSSSFNSLISSYPLSSTSSSSSS